MDGKELPAASPALGCDRLALGFEASPRIPLLLGGDADVADYRFGPGHRVRRLSGISLQAALQAMHGMRSLRSRLSAGGGVASFAATIRRMRPSACFASLVKTAGSEELRAKQRGQVERLTGQNCTGNDRFLYSGSSRLRGGGPRGGRLRRCPGRRWGTVCPPGGPRT